MVDPNGNRVYISGKSMRYCMTCKKITIFMKQPAIRHSCCLTCGRRWARKLTGKDISNKIKEGRE